MKILLLGAGWMGRAITRDIVHFGGKELEKLSIVDRLAGNLESTKQLVADSPVVETRVLDVKNRDQLANLMKEHDTVVSAISYTLNLELTEMAVESGVNFLDLGGNHEIVKEQLNLDKKAEESGVAIIPDNGLAPGLVNILTRDLTDGFIREGWNVENVEFRVGGLPQQPVPPLAYSLVFSVEGLINEYVEPCLVIKDGKLVKEEPLTGVEEITFDGFPRLECFHTSGGSSTLPQTYLGLVRNLNYKTIRYRGHCQKVRLLSDLGLTSSEPVELENGTECVPRKLLTKQLYKTLPKNEKDVILVRVKVSAEREGKQEVHSYEIIDYYDEQSTMTAMMRTTAYPTSIISMMVSKGIINRKGSFTADTCVNTGLMIEELTKRNILVKKDHHQLPG